MVAVGADETAVGGHQLDSCHVAGGQAVLAPEEAQAAAEGVADDADIGRGTCQRGEVVFGGRGDDVDPDVSGRDLGGSESGVNADAAQALGLEQDRVGQRAEGAREVPCALGGYP